MSTRTEWAVLERPTMGVTLETSQRVIPVKSEADARSFVANLPSIYVGVVKRTVTDWEEA
jgi:hypothetical protein